MAKNKFYAVKKGFDKQKNEVVSNLILTSWNETASLVQGVNKKSHGIASEYKGFPTREEAEAFLQKDAPYIHKSEESYPKDALHCYVDGSFSKEIENYSYGLICVEGGKTVVYVDNGVGSNKDAVTMQQIGGELLGTMKALLVAKKKKPKKLVIFFDYEGVALHATGYWKRDNKFSETYYQWMQKFFAENPDIEVTFCKVDAHTGDDFNELADGFAKLALNIQPDSNFYEFVEKYGISKGL